MDPFLPKLPRHIGALLVVALLGSACEARRIVADPIPLCERCHGGSGSAAPPRSARGATDTSDRGVGAHARHLALQGDDVLGALACEECHDVPASVDAHLDGAVPVRLLPSRGASARWDRETGRCTGVSCHGATLREGSRGAATAPEWTRVDGTQMACGSCHAAPPASHAVYAEPASCHRCHAGTVQADGTIDLASGQHIDGTTPGPTACNACHLAPPDSGAHRAHANAADPASVSYGSLAVEVGTSPAGAPAYVFGCGHCHPLDPADHQVDAGGDGLPDVALAPSGGGLKLLHDPAAAWDAGAATCSGVYCHGATLRAGSRGTATAPVWTRVDGSQRTCASCHAEPPASHASYPGAPCGTCHTETVRPDGTIDVAALTHVDGAVQAPSGSGCNACHGAPPATGAHLAHASPADPSAIAYGALTVLEDVAPGGGPSYDFGCGHCHPLDPADHFADAGGDGLPDVVLLPPSPPVAGDDLKAWNDPAAAFDPAGGTCSGVTCHSSGQATPAYVATPAWTAAPGALGCGGCHKNPPRYASGGPGAADANSHLVLADDGWESGHFQGMPGYWHTSKHGGNWSADNDAAPITCQACHAETIDPAAYGPSGFYWLDTTGDYQFPVDAPGADPSRAGPWWENLQCTACHDGAIAPAGAGKVLPLRHVNGRRDVAFDARRALPAISWLPVSPNTPTRPYWVTQVGITLPGTPDIAMEGTTLSMHLGSASYDAATKTCASVACHLFQTQVTWGAPHGWSACGECHPFGF